MLKIKTVCRVLYLLVMYSQSTSASQPSHSEKERYINFDKEGNYTAAAGANFTVKCRSNTPISLTRRWPKNATDEELGVYVDEDEITRIYTAQLTLTDLTYKDVGWFDCIEITSLGLPKIVSFYLFVDDPEHLIAGPRVTRISAKGFLPVVIPCLPTAPDVYVNLLTSDGDPMGFITDQKREDKDWFYYHPTRGFIMPRKLATARWYMYKCEFTKRGVKQRNNIDVLLDGGVQSNFVYLERQGGTKTSEVSAITGSDVLFAAEVFSNYKPTIHWYDKENHEIKTDKKFTVTHILGEPWETRLIIHNVSSTDAGLYTAREGSQKEISFKLHVGDIQTLDIEMEKVFFVSNDNFGAFCRNTPSKPIQNLTWTISRYNCQLQEGCVETLSSLKTHQDVNDIEFNPKFPHAILFNKPMLANISCAMKYLDGTEHSVTRPLIVSEAKDGFETEQKYDISAKTVALTCTVSRFLYSGHLYWIGHDGFVIEKNRTEDGRNITVTRSETFYSYRVTLTIAMKANYTPPVEVYRCMAVDYQHVPSLKSHDLNVNASISQFYEGDLCVPNDQYTEEFGTCINAKSCWHIREDLKNGISPRICTFEGNESIICCRQELDPKQNKEDCGSIPNTASTVERTGQKAWDKCIDNLEYVYPCKNSTTDATCDLGKHCKSTNLTRTYSCRQFKVQQRNSSPVSPLYFGGSQDANEREFPHMALLGYGASAEMARWSCSGTVVSENYVLTAGHCSTYRQFGVVSFIRVGLMQPSDPIDQARLHRVAQVVLHPDSRPNDTFYYNDLALIKTDTPIILDEHVFPACLHTGYLIDDDHMLATGWGLEGGISERLQKIWLEFNDSTYCSQYISSTKANQEYLLKPSQLCFGSLARRRDPCEMDAGGPIQVVNDAVNCTYVVVGVRSFPRICGNYGKPALYTSISPFITWIEQVVWP